MPARRIKIIFPESMPLEEIELALSSGFGGMGTAYSGEDPRVLYLLNFQMPYELITEQLTVLQRDAYLSWEETS